MPLEPDDVLTMARPAPVTNVLLSIGGVVAAIAGAGPSRTSTIASSVAVLLAFLVMLLFAVNSFH